jgi:hypothetical protein
MNMFKTIRTGLVAALAVAGVTASTAAHADSGLIRITLYKAGWFIGGSGGYGTLTFHGRVYPLSIGGVSAGLVFGGSRSQLFGIVHNIHRPSDVAGVYGAASAGVAVTVVGAGAVALTNEKGAVLEVSGRQVGLIANLDLNGMGVALR